MFRLSGIIVLFVVATSFFCMKLSAAQTSREEPIMIGAEIFIEPGQTKEEIDLWFRRLQEHDMTITRIRLFENYMKDANGHWDFQLFDWAFEAGEKYGIKIYGNLFPATPFDDIGGFKFPRSEQHLAEISKYIESVTLHFKKFRSLYGWVPINEPGVNGYLADEPFTVSKFAQWKQERNAELYDSKGYPHFDFAEEKFVLYFNSWFLQWLTDEIHRYDPGRPVHVNNHDIFRNVAEYDFPAWSRFLSSLGGSAHASWHFGYFNRDQYALAVDANCEIIRSGAGNIPWLMTELQGGNNVYSGYDPMCPTAEEIAQWLWISTGTESKGSIFWCLNPRASGVEAGEWALLDFQNEASDRMVVAGKVAETIRSHEDLFSSAGIVESGVNLLYIRESMWVERKLLAAIPEKKYEGRMPGAVMKSLLGYHEALAAAGIQANIKEMGEFDFSREDYTGSAIILAHQVAIPSRYWEAIKTFVNRGGKLVVDGLSGYYDENAVCVMQTGFPFADLFGGLVSEFKFVGGEFTVGMGASGHSLPAHGWKGFIKPGTGEIIGREGQTATAVKNKYGKGEVTWLPSPVGLGARTSGDYGPLSGFLEAELSLGSAIRFSAYHPGVLMKTLKSGDRYISIVINKSGAGQTVDIKGLGEKLQGSVLFTDKSGTVNGRRVAVGSEETLVVLWE